MLASSSAIYGNTTEIATESAEPNPDTVYSKGKLIVEQELIKLHGTDFEVVCLRFGSGYGVSPKPRNATLPAEAGVSGGNQFEAQSKLLSLKSNCKVSVGTSNRVVTLPTGGGLDASRVQKVVQVFNSVVSELQREYAAEKVLVES